MYWRIECEYLIILFMCRQLGMIERRSHVTALHNNILYTVVTDFE